MKTIAIIITLAWTSALVVTLGGCASADRKAKVFGEAMPTLQQVYREKLPLERQQKPAMERQSVQRAIHHRDGDLTGNLRRTHAELRRQFPFLPNPVLMLYIYPHLTPTGMPVPGYYTVLPFYTQDQVALPGEITAPTTVEEGKQ